MALSRKDKGQGTAKAAGQACAVSTCDRPKKRQGRRARSEMSKNLAMGAVYAPSGRESTTLAGQLFRTVGAVLALVLMLATEGSAQMRDYKGYETPAHTVERAEGAVELRLYGPRIVAEVTLTGQRYATISQGFQILAGYIFGRNDTGAKIAMTTPVEQGPADALSATASPDAWVVRFMMPHERTLDTLPHPADPRIRLVELPPERQAVLQFSGFPGGNVLDRRAEDLRAWIVAAGEEILSGPQFMFYDSPMTLPWNRRNEVAFTLR